MDIQKDHVLHSADGRFGGGTTSQVADVRRILGQASAAAPARGLLIHFHGGLVSEASGRGIADRLVPRYAAAGTYPLFFVWESGLVESLQNNLDDIRRDPAFQELTKKVAEWVLKKIGGEVAGGALKGAAGQAVDERELRREFDDWFGGRRPAPPLPDERGPGAAPGPATRGTSDLDPDQLADEIEAGLDDDPDFQDAMARLHAAAFAEKAATKGGGAAPPAEQVLVDERALGEMFPEQTATTRGVLAWWQVARFVAKVVIAVARRYRGGRDHGLYCTVVEEVLRAAYLGQAGTVVWNQMKQDTEQSFADAPEACGTALLDELARLDAAGQGFGRITLVGHSTGAIYICHWLDAAAKRLPAARFDIVFLAPAVTHEMFAAALQKHAARIGAFRMYAMKDALECDDALVPLLYTRSLLYFVSGVLEGRKQGDGWTEDIDSPLVGMQRYLDGGFAGGDLPAVAAIRNFLAADPKRTVWSEIAGAGGLSSASKKHGDFDNDEATITSLVFAVGQGF